MQGNERKYSGICHLLNKNKDSLLIFFSFIYYALQFPFITTFRAKRSCIRSVRFSAIFTIRTIHF